MIYKDYYKILELKTSRVSIDEIKSAYRAAAKKYHPDLNVGDTLAEERIKDINEAIGNYFTEEKDIYTKDINELKIDVSQEFDFIKITFSLVFFY